MRREDKLRKIWQQMEQLLNRPLSAEERGLLALGFAFDDKIKAEEENGDESAA